VGTRSALSDARRLHGFRMASVEEDLHGSLARRSAA
jgi:hypothetical protein